MTDSPTNVPSLALRLVLATVTLVAVAVPTAVVTLAPRAPAHLKLARRVVPKSELPPVEPVELQAAAPSDAKAFNATIPFAIGANPPARPFIFSGSSDARARALDCLATAVIYEAGDDTDGERAVAQVVLNRVRHPAFPKSVCGVVFQGSERSTGCQFSFTCDGSMDRRAPSPQGWRRAREVATAAIKGSVYAPVGYATHYHTDWVVPYWSSSLDKVAAVKSHLFFRWTGWWGTPAAFVRTVSGVEPGIAALRAFSKAHFAAAGDLAEVRSAEVSSAATTGETGAQPLSIDPNSFIVTLDPRAGADSFQTVAMKACGSREYCKLMAWTDKTRTPANLPLGQAQIATMAFSYLRDRARGYEKALWNCAQFERASKGECMKLQVLGVGSASSVPSTVPAPRGPGVTTARANAPGPISNATVVSFTLRPTTPDGLGGVHRKANDASDPVVPSLSKPVLPQPGRP